LSSHAVSTRRQRTSISSRRFETALLAATPWHQTPLVTGFVDLDRHQRPPGRRRQPGSGEW
jgi:hypothetical protein